MKPYRRYPPEVGVMGAVLIGAGIWGLLICVVWWLWL